MVGVANNKSFHELKLYEPWILTEQASIQLRDWPRAVMAITAEKFLPT